MSSTRPDVPRVTSRFGLGHTIGGVLATVSAFEGAIGVGRNVGMVDLGDRIAASGGPPTSEQQQQIAHLGAELEKHGKLDLALLSLAVTAMATARSWEFGTAQRGRAASSSHTVEPRPPPGGDDSLCKPTGQADVGALLPRTSSAPDAFERQLGG